MCQKNSCPPSTQITEQAVKKPITIIRVVENTDKTLPPNYVMAIINTKGIQFVIHQAVIGKCYDCAETNFFELPKNHVAMEMLPELSEYADMAAESILENRIEASFYSKTVEDEEHASLISVFMPVEKSRPITFTIYVPQFKYNYRDYYLFPQNKDNSRLLIALRDVASEVSSVLRKKGVTTLLRPATKAVAKKAVAKKAVAKKVVAKLDVEPSSQPKRTRSKR